MGFLEDDDNGGFDQDLAHDPEMAEQLQALEADFAKLEAAQQQQQQASEEQGPQEGR